MKLSLISRSSSLQDCASSNKVFGSNRRWCHLKVNYEKASFCTYTKSETKSFKLHIKKVNEVASMLWFKFYKVFINDTHTWHCESKRNWFTECYWWQTLFETQLNSKHYTTHKFSVSLTKKNWGNDFNRQLFFLFLIVKGFHIIILMRVR